MSQIRNPAHRVFSEQHFSEVLNVIGGARFRTEYADAQNETTPDSERDSLQHAESILQELAGVFAGQPGVRDDSVQESDSFGEAEDHAKNLEVKYQALLEQVPAVVFMAYLDRGVGEAYVSPAIEAALGYSREEWLEDPVLWYERIHPEDKDRWSAEAAEMFISGKRLRSAYRVLARDGRVIWFQCDARMMRQADGRPWFIHGIGFDITDLKSAEKQLQQERNLASAILQTVDALVLVLDRQGRIVRFNRACEQISGYAFAEVNGKFIWELLQSAEDTERFKAIFREVGTGNAAGHQFESYWLGRDGSARLIAWSTTVLPDTGDALGYVVASGMDITERKHLERTILEIIGREQRRIGQDLHDGLGQQLTGIAFMAKVQQQKLTEKRLPEAADAAKIVHLVNNTISRTRELAKGLAPVVFDAHGLMSALELHAAEVQDLFGVSCLFQCDNPVLIADGSMATHLYHIAQEAVTNAVKHGQAKNILIRLSVVDGRGELVIRDDGKGLVRPPRNHGGMGLQIMKYRADMIRGALEILSESSQGTSICCRFPLEAE